MGKKIFYFFLINSQIVFSTENPYQKFQQFINSKEQYTFNIEIIQAHFRSNYQSNGLLYFFSKDYYIYDDINQRVVYKNNTIKTINKSSKQIIYDSALKNDLNVFDILKGKDIDIVTNNIRQENNNYRIPFAIPNMDISGYLWTRVSNGEPKKIMLNIDEDMKIEVMVTSLNLESNINLSVIDTLGYEIINLRE